MLYLIIILLSFITFYTFTFAKYTWNKGNISGAISVILLGLVTLIFPAIVAMMKLQ